MLEKEVEKEVCDYAKSKGWAHYKFTSPTRRNVPDRLLISPMGSLLFIEFKAPGKEPTAGQLREHRRLEKVKAPVAVVDNVAWGKYLIDNYRTII